MKLDSYDITSNFWKVNPQLVLIFKDFYEEDKSKDKSKSSSLLWCIMLYADNSESNKYHNLTQKERLILITKELDSNFNPEQYKEEIKKYESLFLTKVQKSLRNLELKLEERDEFIASHKYDEMTYEMLDKMLAASDKLYKLLAAAIAEFEKEEIAETVKGGVIESATEKKLI
jgi:hypothetical protein